MSRPASAVRKRPATAGVARPSSAVAANSQASPRPRSANVQAFCRGKVAAQAEAVELCREGLMAVSSQLTAHFAQEFTNLSSTLELKVSEALADHARMADQKMESLIEALHNQRARSESPKRNYFAGLAEDGRQLEANKRLVKRRDEQITQMMLLLEKVETRSRSLERFPDLEAILSQAQEKVEGSGMTKAVVLVVVVVVVGSRRKVSSPRSMTGAGLDSQSMQEFRKLRDGTDTTMQQLGEQMADLADLHRELLGFQKNVNRNFRSTIKEISRIQQALHLDYVVASESESDHEGEIGPVRVGRRESQGTGAPAPVPAKTAPCVSVALAVTASEASSSLPPSPAASSVSSPARALLGPSPARTAPAVRRISTAPPDPEILGRRPSRGRSPAAEEDEEKNAKGAADKRVWKRVREFWTQTELEVEERGAQTEALQRQHKKQAGFAGFFGAKKDKAETTRKGTMNDLEGLKARARKALMKPQYDVANYYKTEGLFQAIARSSIFDQLTVLVVSLNAIWIAIDTDNNDAVLVSDADQVFQVVENVFCTYFFGEIAIRFFAFERKKHAFMDKWFLFDFLLVLNMVIETWILPLVLSLLSGDGAANTIDVSMLRMLRLVKLTRLSRMARVLRSVPELAIIVKAIGLSARSVSVFFLLWLVLIYVFAVVFRQLTDGNDLGAAYFSSVPNAMDTLLMDGILADYAPILHVVGSEGGPLEWCIMLFFVLLAAVTIMYMLVGVLVEVVGALAHAEKESITVGYVASTLRDKMQSHGHDVESPLSKAELQDLLLDPEILEVLSSVQVDVVALMELVNIAYEDAERSGASMNFERIVGLVLNGRGQNTACVKDTSELLRILKQIIIQKTGETTEKLQDEIGIVHRSLQSMREEQFENQGGWQSPRAGSQTNEGNSQD
eukprot:s47_g21.t1